jgi:Tol biopolymer transport system component
LDKSPVSVRRLAFISGNDVWVVEPDKGPPRLLFDGDDRFRFVTRNLSWSPDGGRIAFEHNDESDRPGIFVMNADGSNAQRLTNGESPSWSPDGLALAFTSNRDGTVRFTS